MVEQKVKNDAFADFANAHVSDKDAMQNAKVGMDGLTRVLDAMDYFIQDGAKLAKQAAPAEATGPQEKN